MIKAQLQTVEEMLGAGRFEPASVQREFQWGAEEITRLFVDLLEFMRPHGFAPGPGESLLKGDSDETEQDVTSEATDDEAAEGSVDEEDDADPLDLDALYIPIRKAPPRRRAPEQYFLGQVVLCPAPLTPGRYAIYDGFQRFTTLALMLAALRDTYLDRASAGIARVSELLNKEGGVRFLNAPTPGGVLRRLTGEPVGSLTPPKGASDADWRMSTGWRLLKERMSVWSDLERSQFLKLLLSRVVCNVATVENRSAAYQIFIGANARGKRLDLSDVLKGKIVEVIDLAYPGGKAEGYAQTWRRLNRQLRWRFDDLLRDAEVLRYRSTDAHHPGELIIEEIDSREDVQAVANDLCAWIDRDLTELAASFSRLSSHFGQEHAYAADKALRRLDFLSWNEWRPIAMALDKRHRRDPERRTAQLQMLQKAAYLLELMEWSEQGRREIALEAIAQIESGRDPFRGRYRKGEDPDYGALRFSRRMVDKAKSRLEGPLVSPTTRRAVIRWLETLHWSDGLPLSCTSDASVEHICPQTLKGDWTRSFSEDQHEYWRHRVGNLCLIPQGMNFDLQTGPWAEKRPAFQSLGGTFKLAEDAARAEHWTPEEVSNRHDRLLAKARAALRY